MSDHSDFILQLVAPAATAATFYILLGSTREGVALSGCLSTILTTAAVIAIAVWTSGVTSTAGIGFAFTLAIAACVSFTVVAILYGIDKLRSE